MTEYVRKHLAGRHDQKRHAGIQEQLDDPDDTRLKQTISETVGKIFKSASDRISGHKPRPLESYDIFLSGDDEINIEVDRHGVVKIIGIGVTSKRSENIAREFLRQAEEAVTAWPGTVLCVRSDSGYPLSILENYYYEVKASQRARDLRQNWASEIAAAAKLTEEEQENLAKRLEKIAPSYSATGSLLDDTDYFNSYIRLGDIIHIDIDGFRPIPFLRKTGVDLIYDAPKSHNRRTELNIKHLAGRHDQLRHAGRSANDEIVELSRRFEGDYLADAQYLTRRGSISSKYDVVSIDLTPWNFERTDRPSAEVVTRPGHVYIGRFSNLKSLEDKARAVALVESIRKELWQTTTLIQLEIDPASGYPLSLLDDFCVLVKAEGANELSIRLAEENRRIQYLDEDQTDRLEIKIFSEISKSPLTAMGAEDTETFVVPVSKLADTAGAQAIKKVGIDLVWSRRLRRLTTQEDFRGLKPNTIDLAEEKSDITTPADLRLLGFLEDEKDGYDIDKFLSRYGSVNSKISGLQVLNLVRGSLGPYAELTSVCLDKESVSIVAAMTFGTKISIKVSCLDNARVQLTLGKVYPSDLENLDDVFQCALDVAESLAASSSTKSTRLVTVTFRDDLLLENLLGKDFFAYVNDTFKETATDPDLKDISDTDIVLASTRFINGEKLNLDKEMSRDDEKSAYFKSLIGTLLGREQEGYPIVFRKSGTGFRSILELNRLISKHLSGRHNQKRHAGSTATSAYSYTINEALAVKNILSNSSSDLKTLDQIIALVHGRGEIDRSQVDTAIDTVYRRSSGDQPYSVVVSGKIYVDRLALESDTESVPVRSTLGKNLPGRLHKTVPAIRWSIEINTGLAEGRPQSPTKVELGVDWPSEEEPPMNESAKRSTRYLSSLFPEILKNLESAADSGRIGVLKVEAPVRFPLAMLSKKNWHLYSTSPGYFGHLMTSVKESLSDLGHVTDRQMYEITDQANEAYPHSSSDSPRISYDVGNLEDILADKTARLMLRGASHAVDLEIRYVPEGPRK